MTTMKFLLISLGLIALWSYANAACDKNSKTFYSTTADFLDCIGRQMGKDLDKTATNPEKISKLKKEIVGYYEKADSCPTPNINADLEVYLTHYSYIPKVLRDLVPHIRRLLFLIVQDQDMSQCMMNYLRKKFLIYMKGCLGANIPTGLQGELDNMPVLKDPSPKNVRLFQDWLETLIKGYVALKSCNSRDRKKIIRDMTADARKNLCKCVRSRYSSECKATYNALCPKVSSCINSLVSDPERAFNGNEIKNQALECYDNSRDHGGLTRTDLASTGLKVQQAIQDIKRANTNDKKQFIEFFQQVINAHFSTEFCESDCVLNFLV